MDQQLLSVPIEFDNNQQHQIENVSRLIKKIMQAFRIRLEFLNKKNELLKVIHSNDDYARNEDFFRQLSSLLEHEKHFFEIIGDLAETRKIIDQQILQLRHARSKLPKHFVFKVDGMEIQVDYELIESMLIELNDFVILAERKFDKIKERIYHEERFIRNRDQYTLNYFLVYWADEIKLNLEMIDKFEHSIRHSKAIEFYRRYPWKRFTVPASTSIFGMGASTAIGLAAMVPPGGTVISGVILAAAISMLFGGFFGFFLAFDGTSTFTLKQKNNLTDSKRLIAEIMKAKGAHKTVFQKLFGL